MKNRNGISKVVIIVIAVFAILVVACIIKALSGNDSNKQKRKYIENMKKNNEEYSSMTDDNNYKKITKKDISIVTIDGKDYDLTKTPRELGISIDSVSDGTSEKIENYEEIKEKIIEDIQKYDGNIEEDVALRVFESSGMLSSQDEIIKDIILKPNSSIRVEFDLSIGKGKIKNNSNTPKNIYDCDIVEYSNIYITGGTALGNIEVGKTTEEEIDAIYGSSYIDGEDGSKLSFSMKDGILARITIRFE